jgi:flagellar hook-associated protein 3 FlgL
VGLLNTQNAGRSLFSGTATDRPPLASTDVLLTDLRAAMAGAESVAAMMAAADTWFGAGGGFETLVYQGAATPLAPIQLSEQDQIQLGVQADDPAIREVLKHFAIAALAEDPALNLSPAEKAEVFATTGAGLVVGQGALTSLRTGIGFSQARTEEIAARNAATQTGLEMSRNALLSVDPFEVATQLEDVQFQLQSLYAVTVKSSQLSLVNFL